MFSRASHLAPFVLALAVSASAQNTSEPVVRPVLQNVTRVEAWSFFEPSLEAADSNYTLLSNRAHLGMQVDTARFAVEGSFQYAQLVGLPDQAFGPGPLGPGALYFAASRTPQAFQLYFRSMSLRVKNLAPNLGVQFGRMSYQSGEGTPFAGRLIGTVEWTPFERAFDGVRADYVRRSWRAHGSFVMPTQGAFEESASPTMGKVQVATAAAGTSRFEVFAHNYRDTRAVAARPDNSGVPVESVDVNVQTLGGSLMVQGINAWAAVQRGRWYDHSHGAWSASVDAGYEWTSSTWRPAVRSGVLYASGDNDPNDADHGTFFPMVPTTRPDILAGTFAQMNLRDIYATVTVRPRSRISITGDVHYLSLANRLDRWYTGTGATAFKGNYFGYSSRSSTLRTALGALLQASLTSVINPKWRLKASTAFMHGGSVVNRQFAGTRLWVTSVESIVSLP